MSAITSITSTGSILPTPEADPTTAAAASPGAAAAAVSKAALYQNFGGSAFPSGPYGTRTPINAEDAAVILARAALAVDAAAKAASDNRVAAAAGSVRGAMSDAVAKLKDADKTLAGALASKAEAETALKALRQQETDLRAQIGELTATITALDAGIAVARALHNDPEVARLSHLRDAALDRRDVATGQLGSVQASAAATQGTIDGLNAAIPGYAATVQATTVAALAAYGQVALLFQDKAGTRAQEAVRSTEIDKRLEDAQGLIDDLRQGTLARSEAETKGIEDRRADEVARRIEQLALGLAAGLADALDVLRQSAPPPAPNPREGALGSSRRVQLAL